MATKQSTFENGKLFGVLWFFGNLYAKLVYTDFDLYGGDWKNNETKYLSKIIDKYAFLSKVHYD